MSRHDYQKAIESSINNLKSGGKKFKYVKNSQNMYETLLAFGNQEQATKWAQSLLDLNNTQDYAKQNPCTTVFELVNELNGNSEPLKKEIIKKLKTGK